MTAGKITIISIAKTAIRYFSSAIMGISIIFITIGVGIGIIAFFIQQFSIDEQINDLDYCDR